jgi:hypothetical protein
MIICAAASIHNFLNHSQTGHAANMAKSALLTENGQQGRDRIPQWPNLPVNSPRGGCCLASNGGSERSPRTKSKAEAQRQAEPPSFKAKPFK